MSGSLHIVEALNNKLLFKWQD